MTILICVRIESLGCMVVIVKSDYGLKEKTVLKK
jgi:hypothetical protein